jgi:uncharacterized membrane protein YjgN (DUF898 family)
MENEISDLKNYKLSFHGQGKAFFGIIIVNWLLTIITLGFYFPWAKAKTLKYMYGSTALNNERFTFNGTGKEMFVGFIKCIVFYIVIFGLSFLFSYLDMAILGGIVLYFAVISIIPVAIHGSYRYRFSRTSWKGIRFGYRGERNKLYSGYFKWIFFSIVTLGVYGSWMEMKLRDYLLSNVRAGNIEFKYFGVGKEYFFLNLKGLLLSIITLGVYLSWWENARFAYFVNNLTLTKEGQQIRLKSTASGSEFFKLNIINVLLFIFTLGIGYAWVIARSMKFVTGKIKMSGDMDLDTIQQTEKNNTDAEGEEMTGFLDINFII